MINQIYTNPFAANIQKETNSINILKDIDILGKKSQVNNVKEQKPAEPFFNLLSKALGQVNELDVKAENLMKEYVIYPEKVDIHTVTIAASQAEMALNLTKAIIDRVVSAYKTLSNLR